MRKQLVNGTLGWILKEMPLSLRKQLTADIAAEDERRRTMELPPGENVPTLMSNHLRWMIEHRPLLGDMKMRLFLILRNYLPLTLDSMQMDQLPTLSECSFFWAERLKEKELESELQTA